MRRLIRAYYRLMKNVAVTGNVDFVGELRGIRNSQVKFSSYSKVKLGKDVSINNSKLEVIGGELVIEDGVQITNYSISVGKGCRLTIGKDCVLEKGDNWRKPYILMWDDSVLYIGNNNRLRCDIHTRFGGRCEIAEYNCINERTEIRCDESVTIGSFNMVSYNCRIWDTNTHSFYADDTRRKMTMSMYPNIGAENDRPATKPVTIGSDCLLGEECVVLKGSEIGNKCVVGVRTVVAGKSVPDGKTAVGNPAEVR